MFFSKSTFSFLVTFGAILLNGCPQQQVAGETTTNTEDVKSNPNKPERSDKWLAQQAAFEHKREAGVNFYAFGTEPAWDVAIDADRSLLFEAGKAISLRSGGPTDGVRPADLNAIVYRASGAGAVVTLSAYPDSCTDHSTGELFPYKVTATHRGANGEISSFMGCGLFLTSPRLNDIFALKSWAASGDLRQEFAAEAPRLEFHFDNNTLYGYDGRCEIFGKFEPMGDRIRIYQLDFQDKECRSDNRTPFFDHINGKEHLISFSDGQLTLTNGRDVLSFVKVD